MKYYLNYVPSIIEIIKKLDTPVSHYFLHCYYLGLDENGDYDYSEESDYFFDEIDTRWHKILDNMEFESIYNHTDLTGHVYMGRECVIYIECLYKFGDFYLFYQNPVFGSEEESYHRVYKFDDLLYELDQVQIIPKHKLDLNVLLHKHKKLTQVIEIFEKLSTKEKFIKYVSNKF